MRFDAVGCDELARGWPYPSLPEVLSRLAASTGLQHQMRRGLLLVVANPRLIRNWRRWSTRSAPIEHLWSACARAEVVAARVGSREPDQWPGKETLVKHSQDLAVAIPELHGNDVFIDSAGPATSVVGMIAEGMTADEILDAYPASSSPTCRGAAAAGPTRMGGHDVRTRAGGRHRRLRSPAATPGHLAGCAPPTKGQRYPADPSTVEEIILVMHQAGPGPYADRTRGLIAILWRAGLRISEALALTESDLDSKSGSVLVRQGKGGKRRTVGMDGWAWEHVARWTEHRIQLPIGPLFCILAGPTRGRRSPWPESPPPRRRATGVTPLPTT